MADIAQKNMALTGAVRSALKQKWMNGDYLVHMDAMVSHFDSDRETLTRIIRQYESELLVTKFEIK